MLQDYNIAQGCQPSSLEVLILHSTSFWGLNMNVLQTAIGLAVKSTCRRSALVNIMAVASFQGVAHQSILHVSFEHACFHIVI